MGRIKGHTISPTSPLVTVTPIPAVNNPGAVGDPQFHGLLGQSYQIHGIDGGIYSIVSEACLQMNASFDFLSSGECPIYSEASIMPSNCWSHPGSYFGLLSFITNHGDQIMIQAGEGKEGFHEIMINNKSIMTATTNNNEENVQYPITISLTGHADE